MHQDVTPQYRRRKSDDESFECHLGCTDVQDIEDRLLLGSKRMGVIEASVQDIRTDLTEVLDIVRLGKSFFRAAGYVGAFLKWAAAIAAPVIAVYIAWKSGKS
jgi:hypothetical protein